MNLGIIDYKSGNLRNVQKTIEALDATAKITSNKNDLEHFDALLLPGVGSFYSGINSLKSLGLFDEIIKQIRIKKKTINGYLCRNATFSQRRR